jgi:hypothetical protein
MGTINRNANFSRSAHSRRLDVRAANARISLTGSRGPGVTPEERRHLAECCAFFKAEQYREAAPGHLRASDIRRAGTEIDAAIEHCGNRAGSR